MYLPGFLNIYDKFGSGSHMAYKLHKIGFATYNLERNRDALTVQELRKKSQVHRINEINGTHSITRVFTPMSFSPDQKALCFLKQHLHSDQSLALQDSLAHREIAVGSLLSPCGMASCAALGSGVEIQPRTRDTQLEAYLQLYQCSCKTAHPGQHLFYLCCYF